MKETTIGLGKRMAAVMIDQIRENGDCNLADLYLAGFTEDEVNRGHTAAAAIIGMELNEKIKRELKDRNS
jgi:hypothetical protein